MNESTPIVYQDFIETFPPIVLKGTRDDRPFWSDGHIVLRGPKNSTEVKAFGPIVLDELWNKFDGDFYQVDIPSAPEPVRCRNCRGLGRIDTCAGCNGRGAISCDACGQSRVCRECDGAGRAPHSTRGAPCAACNGAGKRPPDGPLQIEGDYGIHGPHAAWLRRHGASLFTPFRPGELDSLIRRPPMKFTLPGGHDGLAMGRYCVK